VPGVLAMLAVAGIAVTILLFAYRDVPYEDDLWWTFLGDSDAPRSMRALAAALVGGLLVAGWQVAGIQQAKAADPSRADALARASLVFAAATEGQADANLMFVGDKDFVFAPSGRSFVMFRPRGGLWVSMGNPVGAAEEAFPALTAFHEAADRAGKSPVIYAANGDLLPALVELGYVIRKIGETACVDVQAFSLQGPSRSRLRQANNRHQRDGWTVEIIPAGGTVPWDTLKLVSDAWLAAHAGREKTFSLGRFDPEYLARFPVALVRKAGEAPVAFASLWPGPGGREVAVDLMRHAEGAPNGVMDFLFLGIITWAKEEGFQTLDLGMAPLSGLKAGRFSPALANIGQLAYDSGESLYGFRGLRAYKSKFQPEWRPLFIAAPPRVSLPVALAAVALLTSGGVRGLLGLKDA
jgi:phosphatidylglycerol lysyltransferase